MVKRTDRKHDMYDMQEKFILVILGVAHLLIKRRQL